MNGAICPYCGQPMENGFLQTGGGTVAFVKEPRMMCLREDKGDFRIEVSRLTKTCPASYCAACQRLIVSLEQQSGEELERAARGEL